MRGYPPTEVPADGRYHIERLGRGRHGAAPNKRWAIATAHNTSRPRQCHMGHETTNGVKYHNGNSNETYVCGDGTERTLAGRHRQEAVKADY